MQADDHLKSHSPASCLPDFHLDLRRKLDTEHASDPNDINGFDFVVHLRQVSDHRLAQ
jgi:hypothetical protein